MEAIYEIPIIPNNLRNEETIVQIADVLNYLCDIFDDIISKVNNRIDGNKTYLDNLTQRINQSTEKIAKLTGTNKATQVFSSSKYPGAESHKNYKSLFCCSNNKNITLSRTKIKYKNPVLSEYPLEKLEYYHVKINRFKNKSKYIGLEEGLGSFPQDVELINELLLFNTSKNPYKNYVMSDPLQSTQYTREIDELTATGPDAAPLSISQRAALNRSVGENYFYSPGLGDVPSIDVPLDLPDLPGVADDLRYLMESGPAIAPSVTTTPIVPELPSIIQSPSELPVNEINDSDVMPLPPLPTPVVEHVSVKENDSVIEENQPENVVPIVAPINTDTSVAQSVIKPVDLEQVKQKSLPVVEDARASLMAAIRKAGGARNANLRNTETTKDNPDKSMMSGNNLMADLNAKLALRRKGISGTKISDGSEMNSALSRVSAMIPPPQPASSELNESTNTEDEDWDEF